MQVNAVVRELLGWDRVRLEQLKSSTLLALKESRFGDLGEMGRLAECAVALHTRVAVLRAEALTRDAPHDHLDLARSFVQRLAADRAAAPFVRAWHIALADYLAGAASPSPFLGHVQEVLRLYGTDAEALVAVGAGYERVADSPLKPSKQEPLFAEPEPREGEPVVPATPVEMERVQWFNRAASCYRKALARDPASILARLRLGRALVICKQPREAVPELQAVERQATDVPQRFLAALYLGVALDRTHQAETARAAYRRAWELVPTARSAVFALSEIEQRGGSLEEAARIVAQFTGRLPTPRLEDDPWWTLQNDWTSRLTAALQALDGARRR
jgi:tetratricopeptide (TPR) repeat protein